jgi:hypothetical protein
MNIIVNQSDLKFILDRVRDEDLRDTLLQAKEIHRPSKAHAIPDKRYTIALEIVHVEQILELLTDLLVSYGIDHQTYEPNNCGYYIEELIDLFNRYYQDSRDTE